MKTCFCVALTLVLAAPGIAEARTWLVNWEGTGDAPTIQAAIDSAAAADTVLLADGTYTGPGNRDIDFEGKAITVRSQSGHCGTCIINCEGSSGDPHTAFTFDDDEGPGSVLEHITVTGAYGASGGAVGCYYASPTIRGCCFSGNTAGTAGGAIDMTSSSAVIADCSFAGNTSLHSGGAVYMEGSSPTISLCSFDWNTATVYGGALYCYGEAPVMEECGFTANSAAEGGGLCLEGGCTASITYCKFHKNMATLQGGGMRCNGASPTLEGCTFAADSSGCGGAAVHIGGSDAPGFTNTLIAFSKTGSAIGCDPPGGTPGLACCDIYGNEGGDWTGCIAVHAGMNGNMSADPLFCDLPTGDLRVEACSPCLGINNTCGVDIGARGSGCGCGEAVEPATWGSIKRIYR